MTIEASTEDYSIKEIFEEYPNDKLKVKWLNKPFADKRNFQFSYLGVSFCCKSGPETANGTSTAIKLPWSTSTASVCYS